MSGLIPQGQKKSKYFSAGLEKKDTDGGPKIVL